MKKSLLLLIVLFLGVAQAKTFTSQYCEFDLPAGWECALEGSEWVCQSTNKDRQKEAIIILAAKVRGPLDSIEEYTGYLKKKKTFTLPGGKTQVSEPKYAELKNVNTHNWVDSLHLASEVPGFYTRYLATTKEDLGVAVTFSVSKDHYSAYQGIFDKIISTLKVFRQKGLDKNLNFGKSKDVLAGGQGILPGDEQLNIGVQQKKGSIGGGFGQSDYILFILVALGVGVFIYLKKKKKK